MKKKREEERIIFILCMGCGSLYTSNKCTSCIGCGCKSECLDALESNNSKIEGRCPSCIERTAQPIAA